MGGHLDTVDRSSALTDDLEVIGGRALEAAGLGIGREPSPEGPNDEERFSCCVYGLNFGGPAGADDGRR